MLKVIAVIIVCWALITVVTVLLWSRFWSEQEPDLIQEDRMDEARESLADHPPGKPERDYGNHNW